MILDAWSLRLILNPRSLTLGAYHILYPQSLGKPVVSEMDELPENFRRGHEFPEKLKNGGGRVISDLKNFVANSALVVMNFNEQ